jgi:hypothetical protein
VVVEKLDLFIDCNILIWTVYYFLNIILICWWWSIRENNVIAFNILSEFAFFSKYCQCNFCSPSFFLLFFM